MEEMYYTSVNNGTRFNMHVFFHRHIWHKPDLLRLWIIYVCIYLFIHSSFICSLFNETQYLKTLHLTVLWSHLMKWIS